jgi:hypothetical protein
VESFESLSSLAKSDSIGHRFGGAAMIIVALALPYASPLVCDTPDYESSTASTSGADHTSIHSQPPGCGSCDTPMDCCVIPVGPTADRLDHVRLFEHPAPEPAAPALAPSSTAFTPLTPPPKV